VRSVKGDTKLSPSNRVCPTTMLPFLHLGSTQGPQTTPRILDFGFWFGGISQVKVVTSKLFPTCHGPRKQVYVGIFFHFCHMDEFYFTTAGKKRSENQIVDALFRISTMTNSFKYEFIFTTVSTALQFRCSVRNDLRTGKNRIFHPWN
jgi:hypothetical protein